MCRVGGITCNAEGFAGETGAVDVLEGGERDTNDQVELRKVEGGTAAAASTSQEFEC